MSKDIWPPAVYERLGRVLMRFIDRVGDPCEASDPAEHICSELYEAAIKELPQLKTPRGVGAQGKDALLPENANEHGASPGDPEVYVSPHEPVVDDVLSLNIYVNWHHVGHGFGQLSAVLEDNGTIRCGNECMSRDRVRRILIALAHKIADESDLEHPR